MIKVVRTNDVLFNEVKSRFTDYPRARLRKCSYVHRQLFYKPNVSIWNEHIAFHGSLEFFDQIFAFHLIFHIFTNSSRSEQLNTKKFHSFRSQCTVCVLGVVCYLRNDYSNVYASNEIFTMSQCIAGSNGLYFPIISLVYFHHQSVSLDTKQFYYSKSIQFCVT